MEEILSRLSGRRAKIVDEEDYLVSAVVLPILKEYGDEQILFEVRSASLTRQPGEICFPGGKVEEEETEQPLHTAIRETCEELGITPGLLEPIGELDTLLTPHGIIIHPYVCRLKTDVFLPNPHEVEELFTVPLSFFLNNPPQIYTVDIGTRYDEEFPFNRISSGYKQGWQKRWTIPMYVYEYKQYFIWGFTAKIIFNFIKVCWPDNAAYRNIFISAKKRAFK